jgi:hypothetical protein
VVERVQPDQLDAVTTAWIAALGPTRRVLCAASTGIRC